MRGSNLGIKVDAIQQKKGKFVAVDCQNCVLFGIPEKVELYLSGQLKQFSPLCFEVVPCKAEDYENIQRLFSNICNRQF